MAEFRQFGAFSNPYQMPTGNVQYASPALGGPFLERSPFSQGGQVVYGTRGGTIGGIGFQKLPEGTWVASPQAQKYAQSIGKKGIRVLPVGAGDKQEMRHLREEAEREGYLWTEAPQEFERQPSGKFVDPKTGASMGTIMWVGGGYGSRKEKEPVPTPPVAVVSEKEIPSNAMGVSGSPLAFTRFGPTAGINPNLASPFAGGFGNSRLTGFGGIPRFPFAGY